MIAQSSSSESSRKRDREHSPTRQEASPEEDDGTTDWKAYSHETLQSLKEETRKNTELNLQLMFVRSECVRLMGVQDVMNQSITKLQDSLNDWIKAVTSDDEGEEDNDEENDDDNHANNNNHGTNSDEEGGDDSEGDSTDGEDVTSKRRRKLINVVGNNSR